MEVLFLIFALLALLHLRVVDFLGEKVGGVLLVDVEVEGVVHESFEHFVFEVGPIEYLDDGQDSDDQPSYLRDSLKYLSC